MSKKMASHGGNIYKKAKELNIPESEILDFSANISPLGTPEAIKKAIVESLDGVINYPDPDCGDLTEAIAAFDGVKPEYILCGNGGADLLFRIALALKPKKVLLPVPAFVEYEEALCAVDAQMDYFYLEEDFRVKESLLSAMKEQDLLVICNPNNPTGLLVERELLLRILQKAKDCNMKVLLDECFLEIYPEEEKYTLKRHLEAFPNLMILKSFTKMYAIPGVRLGYLMCSDQELLQKIRRCGQAWSVSHFAQAAGLAALNETAYRESTIRVIQQENAFMREELSKLPITLYQGVVNYLFFRAPGVADLDKRLERHGIMIRNCSNYVNLGEEYFRVAVKSREDNLRLLVAMKQELTGEREEENASASKEVDAKNDLQKYAEAAEKLQDGISQENGADDMLRRHILAAKKERGISETDEIPEQCKTCTVYGCGGMADSSEGMGRVHVYYGPGKGKTSTALGVALRCAGAGYKILIHSFIATNTSSEVEALKELSNVTYVPSIPLKRYTFMMSEEEKAQARQQNDRKLEELMEQAKAYDMLVLDEALYAVEVGILTEEKLMEYLIRKPCPLEIVLTGKTPSEKILAVADYATEMKKVKHPLDFGLSSRLGIEK